MQRVHARLLRDHCGTLAQASIRGSRQHFWGCAILSRTPVIPWSGCMTAKRQSKWYGRTDYLGYSMACASPGP